MARTMWNKRSIRENGVPGKRRGASHTTHQLRRRVHPAVVVRLRGTAPTQRSADVYGLNTEVGRKMTKLRAGKSMYG